MSDSLTIVVIWWAIAYWWIWVPATCVLAGLSLGRLLWRRGGK